MGAHEHSDDSILFLMKWTLTIQSENWKVSLIIEPH